MTVLFVSPTKRTSHECYSIGRVPVVGEYVSCNKEVSEGKTLTFEGIVEKVEWTFGMGVKDHRVLVFLKEEQ